MKKLRLLFTVLVSFFGLVNGLKAQDQIKYYCPPCGTCDSVAYDKPGSCPHCGMALINQTAAQHLNNQKRFKVAFYLQDGVEVLDFAGPMEVFANSGFDVFTVSATHGQIKAQGILKITPDYSIDDAPHADIIAFFGGNSDVASNDSKVMSWLTGQKDVSYYFSVCTGAFIMSKAGLLDGLTVTTFHSSIDELKLKTPKAKVLANVRFVDNGKVITTAGISAGIDGALHLVAKIRGEEIAAQTAVYMEYDKWVPSQGLVVKPAAKSL